MNETSHQIEYIEQKLNSIRIPLDKWLEQFNSAGRVPASHYQIDTNDLFLLLSFVMALKGCLKRDKIAFQQRIHDLLEWRDDFDPKNEETELIHKGMQKAFKMVLELIDCK